MRATVMSILLLPWASPAAAQDQPPAPAPEAQPAPTPPPAPPPPDPRIEALERKQRELEERLAKTEAATREHFGAAGGVGAGEGGFLLHSPDNAFLLNIRGYVQADERFYLDTSPSTPTTFLLRRVRPVLEGTVFRYFGFKIMPDFGQGQATIQDAWAEFRPCDEFSLLVGKLKPPVGLERLQSARHILFVERGLPTNLVPNRDVGIQISGTFGKGLLYYAISVFDGTIDTGVNDGDVNDEKDLIGRIFIQPLRPLNNPWFDNLGAGFSFSTGNQYGATPQNTLLPSYKSISQLTFFSYVSDGTVNGTVIAFGDKTRLSPHGYWYAGPFGILAEYVWTSQNTRKGAVKADFDFSAWQVAASAFVFGGRPTFDGVIIDTPYDPKAGHYGALELAARYNQQNDDPKTFEIGFADPTRSARTIHAVSGGLNWHFNRSYKLEADLEYANYDGGAKNGNRGSETSILSRVQVAF